MTNLKLCLVVSLVIAGCDRPPRREPADLVLLHGKIVTVDDDVPEAKALAAKDGRIVAVGSDADIEPYIGDDTRVVDIEGLMTIPDDEIRATEVVYTIIGGEVKYEAR